MKLFGHIEVHEAPEGLTRLPVLQVSPTFKWCSDEARARMNAWLRERFGTQEHVFFFGGRAVASRAVIRRLGGVVQDFPR